MSDLSRTTPPPDERPRPQAGLSRRQLLRTAGAGALALGGGGLLAACGGRSSSTATVSAAAKGAKTGKVHNLVLLSNEWNTVMTDAARRTAGLLGLQYSESVFDTDETVALSQAETAIAAGARMLIVQAADGSAIPQLGRLCQQRGVYLSNMNATAPWYSPLDTGDKAAWFFTQADWDGFYASTKAALQVVSDRTGGKGTVLHVSGLPGSGIDAIRTGAVRRALAEFPGLQLQGSLPGKWSAEGGQKATEDLVSRYGVPDAIVSQNDGQLTGVLAALRGLGKQPGKDVVVCGCDGATDILKEVQAGTVQTTSFSSPAFFGVASTVRLFDAFNGLEATPGERQMRFGGVTVTKANADALITRYVDSDNLPFDPVKMSRTLSGRDWDPQAELGALDVDQYWKDAGIARPKGYETPRAYTRAVADGELRRVDRRYAAAYRTRFDDPSFAGIKT